MTKRLLNIISGVILVASIFSLGFFSDKCIRYWHYFTIKREIDLPATMLGFSTTAVTIGAAYWVAKILEKEKDEGRTEKNLIIDKVHDLLLSIEQLNDKVSSRSIPLIDATAHVKRITTNISLIKDILSNTHIKAPGKLQLEIEACIRSLNKLLTDTPATPGPNDPVKVVSGQIIVSDMGMAALDKEFDILSNNVLKYQLSINKG
jgi:hypothetical protein